MSKIDKLSILGVRSFDNTRSETIQFFSPLTLIVGYNGSGKTTIIECLKYATTGGQPPNTSGRGGNSTNGSFIHDPALCGEKEVLAQVKLSFKATSGAKMVATRSLQLTAEKTKRTLKTLEGQLLMVKDGERIAVSSRVAELNQIIPQYLGVSKAVLDNVLFCPQDESLWPVSEPRVLKQKFDEIFEASKWTKAVDNIKLLRKNQNEELAKLKITEKHEKENKDKGEKAERQARKISAEIEELRAQSERMDQEIQNAQDRANAAWDSAGQFERIITKLDGKRADAGRKDESIREIKSDLRELQDSDEVLRSQLDNFEERAASYASEIASKTASYNDLARRAAEKKAQLGEKQTAYGEHKSNKATFDRLVQERDALIKETARRHNIRGFDRTLDEAQIQNFMARLPKMAKDQDEALERAHEESQKEVSVAQVALAKLNEQKTTLTTRKENCKSQTLVNDRKIESHQLKLNEITVDEGAKAKLESAVEDIRKKLQESKAKSESAAWDQEIKSAESELRRLDDRKDELDEEAAQANRQANETVQLDQTRRSLKDNTTGLEKMNGAHSERISNVIGSQWQINNLETVFQKASEAKATELKEAESQRDGISRELEQLDFKIDTSKEQLATKSEQAKRFEKEVQDALGEDPITEYEETVRSVESSRDTLLGDKDSLARVLKWYEDCKQTLVEHDVCRLCERQFNTEKERKKFSDKIEQMIQRSRAETNEELDQQESDLKALRAVGPSHDMWKRLRNIEIPAVEQELRRLNPLREDLVSRLESQDRVVEERNAAKRGLDSIEKTVRTIAKYVNDISVAENQIKELEHKLSQAGMSRGIEAISEEQRSVTEKARSVRKSLNSLLGDRDVSRKQINDFEIEVRDTNEKLRDAEAKLKERDAITAQIEELQESSREQKNVVIAIDQELQTLAQQISQAQERYGDAQRRGDDRQKEIQKDVSSIHNSLNQLQNGETYIKSYIEDDGASKLAAAERDLEQIRQEQTRIENEQVQLTREIKKLEQEEQSQGETKRNIARNLKYRSDIRALEELKKEVAALENQNAEADRDHHASEGNKWQVERNRLAGEQANITGQMKSKDNELLRLENDYNTDYKDAADKYREAHIKVEATKAAVEDLGRYAGALDQAIMKYHGLKMDEVNAVIEELWRKTYQGTDVDTILIRADNENLRGNKSYNYGVCMVKQDVEMDMRGRCSAGQKVLASIIIRLALAECFGVNCGVIALDEPTTNLDRDNIRALAAALHEIIKARASQSNFQLIVITHDEEFLRHMKCDDFCDYYYRVSRNERQKSEIDQQTIWEVM